MNKLKIIRATTVPRSLNDFCKGIMSELSKKYEVIGLSSPGRDLDELAEREEVRVIAVPMERHISLLKDWMSLLKMWRVFRDENPTMVHSMTPKAGMICMVAAWFARVPVRVHTFTGLVFPTSTGFRRKVLMFADWLTCKCATHIIPEGEGVKSDLLNNRITNKPLKVLGYGNVKGVDMVHFSRRPAVMEIVSQRSLRKADCFVFLFVGRIVRDKGINELCAAFNRLHQQEPMTRLLLIGEYEETLDPISFETRKLIEDDQSGISFMGMKIGDELLAYYSSSDCFVMPSFREGFPNTVLEAGAMDLPCIVTDINGSREIIKDGFNGLIVPPHNTEALFYAMKRMVDDKELRERMTNVCRQHIASHYEQGFVRQCLYDFYEEIMPAEKNGYV